MSYPLLGICGPAGSGKDTIAAIVARVLNGTCIAQADPMKRLAAKLFGFTEDQLWGPSASRNATDPNLSVAAFKEMLAEAEAALKNQEDPRVYALTRQKMNPWLMPLGLEYPDHRQELLLWYKGVLEVAITQGGITPRYVLQTLGTEWGRKQYAAIWVNQALFAATCVLVDGRGYNRGHGVLDRRVAVDERIPVGGRDYVVITDVRFRNEVLAIKQAGGQVWQVFDPNNSTEVTGGVAGHVSETEMTSIPRFYFDARISNDKTQGVGALEEALVSFPDSPLGKLRASAPVTRIYNWREEED